jgi:hypothetical protein
MIIILWGPRIALIGHRLRLDLNTLSVLLVRPTYITIGITLLITYK